MTNDRLRLRMHIECMTDKEMTGLDIEPSERNDYPRKSVAEHAKTKKANERKSSNLADGVLIDQLINLN
ncbi:hypothetical protein WR25_16358 [Diploscapter pachys]|uniref:Uncharacterized protein n=1 Tax=Diploscapter pachys TaxID=2018661 RepID=A0A2A2LAY9_9BILA|nr:hypothetical protein WR25_16358 [Diploscapter pachys]